MKPMANKGMRTAIIHYWLVGMRGGEKVVEALCEMFPDADVFTHVYDPKKISPTITSHPVHTSFIQKLPFARRLYKQYMPLMPGALERLDLSAYDLVISSESGPAKGVIVRPDALHVCYCHTPMRYLWDQYHHYHEASGMLSRTGLSLLSGRLRQWDVTSAARVDHFIANSTAVASRVRKYWRRSAEVISPPVDTAKFVARQDRDDFYLHVGELVPYKRVDIAVEACTLLERRLVVIGDGPDMAALKAKAGPTVEFLGRVPDDVLADHYARCKALLFPAEEDFGIVPVEAMAAGAPVLAFSRGGARDYVSDGETGLFFDDQSPQGLVGSIIRYEMMEDRFDHHAIAAFARGFDRAVFDQNMKSAILRVMDGEPDMDGHRDALAERWRNDAPVAVPLLRSAVATKRTNAAPVAHLETGKAKPSIERLPSANGSNEARPPA